MLFTCSDTRQLYQQNLKTQPEDWIYRTKHISYNYNDNGHRCKNISDINLDNYILFTGCSHTEGVGLCLEDTFPYLLSQKMNYDYYNMGLGGIGLDILVYNLIIWFEKVKKPPKILIIQWPHNVRVTVQDFSNLSVIDPVPYFNYGVWSADTNREMGRFLVLGEKLNFFNTVSILSKTLIKNITPCPIIELGSWRDPNAKVDLYLKYLDHARDVRDNKISHMGITSNMVNTDLIFDKLKMLGL
jgi:hypothetical protein